MVIAPAPVYRIAFIDLPIYHNFQLFCWHFIRIIRIATHSMTSQQNPLPHVEFYPIEIRNDVRTNHWNTSKENSPHPERMARYDSLLKTLPRFFETSFYWWSHL
mgnify:CR=1 FL=1